MRFVRLVAQRTYKRALYSIISKPTGTFSDSYRTVGFERIICFYYFKDPKKDSILKKYIRTVGSSMRFLYIKTKNESEFALKLCIRKLQANSTD